MDSTPAASSTVTSSSSTPSSSVSSNTPRPPSHYHLLEISIISAQDLSHVCKSMHIYAVTWIHPTRKFITRIDQQGHNNPTWNEKFDFRLDKESLLSEAMAVTVEFYARSWFKDILVGTTRVLLSDLITPLIQLAPNHLNNARFMALKVCCPSGTPQGILTMGVSLLDNSMKSRTLHNHLVNHRTDDLQGGLLKKVTSPSQVPHEHGDEEEDDENNELNTKIQLWRSQSTGSGFINNGSMVNGSIVNGSELCSDIGPSASVVAAELAVKSQLPSVATQSNQMIKLNRNGHEEETGSSILEDLTIEEAKAKGYKIRTRDRWRKDCNANECDEQSDLSNISSQSRRNSDGGLFSCFGSAYGIEFKIVCGGSNKGVHKINYRKSRRKKSSEANSA